MMCMETMPPAGLSSGQAQRARDRGAVCNDAKEYYSKPYSGAGMTALPILGSDGSQPPPQPLKAHHLLTHRHTNPLSPSYQLPSAPPQEPLYPSPPSSPVRRAGQQLFPSIPTATLSATAHAPYAAGVPPHSPDRPNKHPGAAGAVQPDTLTPCAVGDATQPLNLTFVRPNTLDVHDINFPPSTTAAALSTLTAGSQSAPPSPGAYQNPQHRHHPNRLLGTHVAEVANQTRRPPHTRFGSVPTSPVEAASRLGGGSSAAVANSLVQYAYYVPPTSAPAEYGAGAAASSPGPAHLAVHAASAGTAPPHAAGNCASINGDLRYATKYEAVVGDAAGSVPSATRAASYFQAQGQAAQAAPPAGLPARRHPALPSAVAGTGAATGALLSFSTAGAGMAEEMQPEAGAAAARTPPPKWHAQRYDNLYIRDIVPPRVPSPERPLKCLQTSDVAGAMPQRPCARSVPSPGGGTLQCRDVQGTGPGIINANTSAILAMLTTGRWPLPQKPKPVFSTLPRRTVVQRPLNMME